MQKCKKNQKVQKGNKAKSQEQKFHENMAGLPQVKGEGEGGGDEEEDSQGTLQNWSSCPGQWQHGRNMVYVGQSAPGSLHHPIPKGDVATQGILSVPFQDIG